MEKTSKLILTILGISIVAVLVVGSIFLFNLNSQVKNESNQAEMFKNNESNVENSTNTSPIVDEKMIFKYSYENNAWGKKEYGYNIYFDGNIEGYDKYDESNNKTAQITNEELEKIKKYANQIEDNYKSNNDRNFDAGSSEYKIYSINKEKWITVKKGGVTTGSDTSEISEELVAFANSLYNKYLK